tara:strand:+ start:2289 stop:2675 length:387 start_codon:yes stop_codon:yes gene_type:complete
MILKKKFLKEKMYDENNIFAKILRKEIPCEKIFEDDEVLFFNDINPVAKVHVLGIPKIKCIDFEDFFKQASQQTFNNFFQKTFMVVEKLSLKEGGYRIVTNTGNNGGQIVFHFHIHIIGGENLGAKIG